MNCLTQINPNDSVAVALMPLKAGEKYDCQGRTVIPGSDIPMGHKVALKNIAKGEKVIKYGYPIGYLLSNAKAGEHIHTHNIFTQNTYTQSMNRRNMNTKAFYA